MAVKDSRTEEERGSAADLLKLVMVRQERAHAGVWAVVSVLGAPGHKRSGSGSCHFWEAFSPSL